MSDFVKAAQLTDFPDSGILALELDDRFVVLVKTDQGVYCLDDVCTHDGGPLGDGHLDSGCIVCPRHGAKFELCSGKAMAMPATEATAAHEVRLDGGSVFVRLAN